MISKLNAKMAGRLFNKSENSSKSLTKISNSNQIIHSKMDLN